eukprot:scaffold17516_cov22-Cyclotella_meneghiniana.AAC.1
MSLRTARQLVCLRDAVIPRILTNFWPVNDDLLQQITASGMIELATPIRRVSRYVNGSANRLIMPP